MGLALLSSPRSMLAAFGGEELMSKHSEESLATMFILVSRFGFVLASSVGLVMAVVIFGDAAARAHLNLGIGIANTIAIANIGFNFLGTMKELDIDSPSLIGSLLVSMVLAAMNLVAWKSSGAGVPSLLMRPINVPRQLDMNYSIIFFATMYASAIGLCSLLRPALLLDLFGFAELDRTGSLVLTMFARGLGFLLLSFSAVLLTVLSSHHTKTINFSTLWLAVCSLGWITLGSGQHPMWAATNNFQAPLITSFDFLVHLSLLLVCLLAFVRSDDWPELEEGTPFEWEQAASLWPEKEQLQREQPRLAKSHAA